MTDSMNFKKGLNDHEVALARTAFGANTMPGTDKNIVIESVKAFLNEPMVLLLIVASILYFINGEIAESIFLAVSVVFVFSISRFQESKSARALKSLEGLTQPRCKVIRNSKSINIPTSDLVVGDTIVIEEGWSIPADAEILASHDFTVNESVLTGESVAVVKSETSGDHVFRGTSVSSGSAVCRIIAVGSKTKLGEIGTVVRTIHSEKSPLQKQINRFVKAMTWGGVIIFMIILLLNLLHSNGFFNSVLSSLTLAMSLLPEEIPVAVSTFLALGARTLMQSGIIVKHVNTIETLGAASVICLDKTGTITQNTMRLDVVYVHDQRQQFPIANNPAIQPLITYAMWASEPTPFDPMELEIHRVYQSVSAQDERPNYSLHKEYPLAGRPPFMTHVFSDGKGRLIMAGKGAPMAILNHSVLTDSDRQAVMDVLNDFSKKGFRVLAVGQGIINGPLPEKQDSISFVFKGLLAFYDPPRENMAKTLQTFLEAGIKVRMLTGDDMHTASAIARNVGLKVNESLSGEAIMAMNEQELQNSFKNVSLFYRMFPEAKLRVVNALKKASEVVAMTGDGVNDAPALKAAHIGVAMGGKGTDAAKEAAALILPNDDISKMIDAMAVGRKIHTNLKKAIRYVISIHIPIILIVFIPLLLNWTYPVVFTPIHVILLELMMGPICSIVFEREPMEPGTMLKPPRPTDAPLFSPGEMIMGVVQGTMIAIGLVLVYFYSVDASYSNRQVTTLIFIALAHSNIWLMLVNRSFTKSILSTIMTRNVLVPSMASVIVLAVTAMYTYEPLRNFFRFELVSPGSFTICILISFLSVIWIEIFKALVRRN